VETKILAPTTENIALAGQLLRDGRLVALHTETVYGLAANAFDTAAVSEIFAVKGRPQDNPLIVHIADVDDVHRLTRWFPETARKLAGAFWPGPLTMVLPKNKAVPYAVTCGLDTVALRMPGSPVMLAAIRAAGTPLAAPSANRSGRPSPTRAAHVMDDLGGKIPLIIDGGSCEIGVESTVISIIASRTDGAVPAKIKILRPGAVTADEIAAATGLSVGSDIEIDPAVLSPLPEDAAPPSPGMKHRHYAPRAEVILVEGDFDGFADVVSRVVGDAGPYKLWAMCFAGEGDKLSVPYIEYGGENDHLGQCGAIFDALRRLDAMGAERVYVRAPSRDGIGLAAYNRLLRAAGFRVVNLHKET